MAILPSWSASLPREASRLSGSVAVRVPTAAPPRSAQSERRARIWTRVLDLDRTFFRDHTIPCRRPPATRAARKRWPGGPPNRPMAGRLAQWTALDVASGWCKGEREFPPILTRYSLRALPRTRFPCVPCARCARALGFSSRGVRDVACRRGAVLQGVCRARRGGSGPSRCAAQYTAARWWATRLGKEQAQKRAQPPSQLPRALLHSAPACPSPRGDARL